MSGSALFSEMAGVLEPLAADLHGQDCEVIRSALAGAWLRAFDAELPEPTLTRCARAIHDRASWSEELWPGGWTRPALPRIRPYP